MTEKNRAYEFAFHVGGGALFALILATVALWEYRLIFFAMMFAWTLITLFVLPWVYVCLQSGEIHLPPWLRFV